MTPEGKVKKKVTELLRSYGDDVYFVMPVVSGMGQPQLDYVGCAAGWYFAIETKAPDGKVTDRQKTIIDRIDAADGSAYVVRTDEDLAHVKRWLDLVLAR